MTVGSDDLILWGIAEEHLDEAGFLFEMRSKRLSAPHYTLNEVRGGPEHRLLAHVDGLVVGGSAVRERLLISTAGDDEAEPERLAAAALALLGGETPHLLMDVLVASLCREQGARLDALVAALSLANRAEVPQRLLKEVNKDHSPAVVAAMLRVLAAYRVDPADVLVKLLQSTHPAIAQAALVVAARVPRQDCLALCERLIESDVAETRNRAIDAALVNGSSLAWSVCIHRAARPTNDDAHCLLLCGLLGNAQEHRYLADLLRAGSHIGAALWAIGFAGRADHVPVVLSFLGHSEERVARLAGEAFASMTGYTPKKIARLAPVTAKVPELVDTLPTFDEDDLEADLVPSTVAQLPWLERDPARTWWEQHGGRFAAGTRYVAGQPMSVAAVHSALRNGPARRRYPWGLAVSIASGGEQIVSTEALCELQLAQLRALERCEPSALRWLFR